jgi:hypothetical protein
MGTKVTADPVTRIIAVTDIPILENGEYVVDLDIQEELYSDLKKDWVASESLRKLKFPIRAVGGDPLPGSKVLGDTYFIASDWKVAPYESSHRFRVNGNFYSEDGTSPFKNTVGAFNLFLEQTVSSLVDSTVAQLSEIEYASFGGGVTVDTVNGFALAEGANGVLADGRIIGTPRAPVLSMEDALTIASSRGFVTFYIIGDVLVDSGLDYSNKVFFGQGENLSDITVSSAANVLNCAFHSALITGTLDGESKVQGCVIDTLIYVSGVIDGCTLNSGVIQLGGNTEALIINCQSGVPGLLTPIIDCGGLGQALAMRNYNGGATLRNKTGEDSISIDLSSGQIILENTVTSGDITVRGIGKLVDSVGTPIYTGTWNGVEIVNELVNSTQFARELLGTTSFVA